MYPLMIVKILPEFRREEKFLDERFKMIRKNVDTYATITEAAKKFGVSTRTVREWIKKKIIPEPPTIEYGIRLIYYFPQDYMITAEDKLKSIMIMKQHKLSEIKI